jgi:hypothetical protein
MQPNRPDNPPRNPAVRPQQIELEALRVEEENKRRDIERSRREIEARLRREQLLRLFHRHLHALKRALLVAVPVWLAGLLPFMLLGGSRLAVAAAYSALSFGLLAFLPTYVLDLEKSLADEPHERAGVGAWVWYLIAAVVLFVGWVASQEADHRAADAAANPSAQAAPAEPEAEPLTGIGQVRMPQPPPRPEPEVAAVSKPRARPVAGDSPARSSEPKLPCVIKQVMTDEEIRRCRDS